MWINDEHPNLMAKKKRTHKWLTNTIPFSESHHVAACQLQCAPHARSFTNLTSVPVVCWSLNICPTKEILSTPVSFCDHVCVPPLSATEAVPSLRSRSAHSRSDHCDELSASPQLFGIRWCTEFSGATELKPSTSASSNADRAGDVQAEGLHQLCVALGTCEAPHPAVTDERHVKRGARFQRPFCAKEGHVCELLQQSGAREVCWAFCPAVIQLRRPNRSGKVTVGASFTVCRRNRAVSSFTSVLITVPNIEHNIVLGGIELRSIDFSHLHCGPNDVERHQRDQRLRVPPHDTATEQQSKLCWSVS